MLPMKVCNHCWFILDEQLNRVRVMLPNDDNKYIDHETCNDCRNDLDRLQPLYLTKREIARVQAPATI